MAKSSLPKTNSPINNRVQLRCQRCEKIFFKLPCQLGRGRGKFCSHSCSSAAMIVEKQPCAVESCPANCVGSSIYCQKHLHRFNRHGDPSVVLVRQGEPEQRFWEWVDRTSTCWLWKGGKDKNGYGIFTVEGENFYAHRYSFYLTYGSFPQPIGRHTCDTPACVRPDHIIEGTQPENVADMVGKGRQSRGETNGNNKLNVREVVLIKQRLGAGERVSVIAKAYGLSWSSINDIKKGRNWKHVIAVIA